MKAILFSILLAVALCASELHYASDNAEVGSPLSDFVEGLLRGLEAKEDVEKIKACLKHLDKEFEVFLAKLQEAFEHLKHINPIELAKGLQIFFDALKELLSKTIHCFSEESIIRKLMRLISIVQILKLVAVILLRPALFLSLIIQGIQFIKEKNYEMVGYLVGQLLLLLIVI